MKNIIQIIGIEKLAGRSAKGNDYDMRLAQCIVERIDSETGESAPLIGELVLPEKFKTCTPGRYEVEFEIGVSREKRIISNVASMTLVAPASARSAAVPPAASSKAST